VEPRRTRWLFLSIEGNNRGVEVSKSQTWSVLSFTDLVRSQETSEEESSDSCTLYGLYSASTSCSFSMEGLSQESFQVVLVRISLFACSRFSLRTLVFVGVSLCYDASR